ncbi:DUF305 domain-containing protein [Phenylobacterium soli]|uniref:DUF305 domain-containing protein n=1 Tax=Phenylobacterium soli TaxID=2170551 RepID=A0A328ANU4_9CAUL|nr:DUF305 domain-containing protein [Phenylobacterium soli]RAK56249.1 DUF305 domain-containing protein [Phenylobacterium soli]
MAALHFAAMFALMYAMVDRVANVLPNLNQAYMAAMMTAPMLIFELLLMGSMYPQRRLNLGLGGAGLAILVGAFAATPAQSAIGDAQFLRSMIPHHAGALLMCKQARLRDRDIRALCATITRGQQAEIDWMKAKLLATQGGRPAPPPPKV